LSRGIAQGLAEGGTGVGVDDLLIDDSGDDHLLIEDGTTDVRKLED